MARSAVELASIKMFFREMFQDEDPLYALIEKEDWLDELFSDEHRLFQEIVIDEQMKYDNADAAELVNIKGGAQRIINLMNGQGGKLKEYISPLFYAGKYRHDTKSIFKLHMIHYLLTKDVKLSEIYEHLNYASPQAIIGEGSSVKRERGKGKNDTDSGMQSEQVIKLIREENYKVTKTVFTLIAAVGEMNNHNQGLVSNMVSLKEEAVINELLKLNTELDAIVEESLHINDRKYDCEKAIIELKNHLFHLEKLKLTAQTVTENNRNEVAPTDVNESGGWLKKLFGGRSNNAQQPVKQGQDESVGLIKDLVDSIDIEQEMASIKSKIQEREEEKTRLNSRLEEIHTKKDLKKSEIETVKSSDWRSQLQKAIEQDAPKSINLESLQRMALELQMQNEEHELQQPKTQRSNIINAESLSVVEMDEDN